MNEWTRGLCTTSLTRAKFSSNKQAWANLWLYKSVGKESPSSPLGRGKGNSFEQSSIPFNQGCFEPSFSEISPVVLEKKNINAILLCHYLSPLWKKCGSLYEQPQIHSTGLTQCIVSSLVEIHLEVLGMILKSCLNNFGICFTSIYFGFECNPSFEEIYIPRIQGFFVQSLVVSSPVLLEKIEM